MLISSTSSPSPLSGNSGDETESSNLPVTRLVSWKPAPILRVSSHLMSITKVIFTAVDTGIFKGFKSSVPETKTKYAFFFFFFFTINHNITKPCEQRKELFLLKMRGSCKHLASPLSPAHSPKCLLARGVDSPGERRHPSLS